MVPIQRYVDKNELSQALAEWCDIFAEISDFLLKEVEISLNAHRLGLGNWPLADYRQERLLVGLG